MDKARPLILSCNVTVDGFMAGPDSDLDFIVDDGWRRHGGLAERDPEGPVRRSSADLSAWANATVAASDGVEEVRCLKPSSGGALVTFGGVQTLRSLVASTSSTSTG